jgi:hypothetical protein
MQIFECVFSDISILEVKMAQLEKAGGLSSCELGRSSTWQRDWKFVREFEPGTGQR